MSRTRPPKELRERRGQRSANKKPKAGWPDTSTARFDWKFWIVSVGGLALTSVLAIAALYLSAEDRPTVLMGSPHDPKDVMTTEIEFVNHGVFPLRNVSFDVFVKHAAFSGKGSFDNGFAGLEKWLTPILRADEPVQVELGHAIGGHTQYSECDLAIVAHYVPSWAPFWKRDRIFRFKTVLDETGRNKLQQIPSGDIEIDYREAADEAERLRSRTGQ